MVLSTYEMSIPLVEAPQSARQVATGHSLPMYDGQKALLRGACCLCLLWDSALDAQEEDGVMLREQYIISNGHRYY